MREEGDFELDAVLRIAKLLPQDRRNEFLSLIPEETRQKLPADLLATTLGSEAEKSTTQKTRPAYLPPTLIIEPDQHPTTTEQPQAPPEVGYDSQTAKLIKLHAKGAVGEVYVAFDEQLSREVALKRIRPDLPHSARRFDRFVREAEITAKLQHPCIVPIYDFQHSGDDAHYTMPLVSGSNLSALISATHKDIDHQTNRYSWIASIRPLLSHFIAVCNAIDYAHSQNVLHRDIKPENIMIGTQGQTIVLDWGCAKDLDVAGSDGGPEIEDKELAEILGVSPKKGMTIAGSVMGTIEFMSPEQAAGDGARVGKRSDIFGLGSTLFNILTNESAIEFSRDGQIDIDQALENVKQGNHRRVEQVSAQAPKPLAAICHRAMAFAPEDRYETAGELAREVGAFLAGEPVSVYKETFGDRTLRFIRRHRTAFTTLLGMLLVGFLSLTLVAVNINAQREILADQNRKTTDLNKRLIQSIETEKKLTIAAKVREKQSKQHLYETEMLLASEACSEPGGFGRMRELVQRWDDPELLEFTGWEWGHLNAVGKQEFWTEQLDVTGNKIVYTPGGLLGRVFDYDRSIMLTIDTDNKTVLAGRPLPTGTSAADLNKDQSLLAVGLQSGSVMVLDLKNDDAKPVELKKLTSAVTDISWNTGGDYLAASDSSGELAVWQWNERKLHATGSDVLNIARKRLLNWSYDGKRLSWTTGQELRELILKNGKESVIAEDSWIVSPSWSHEGKLLSWVGPDNSIVVQNTETDQITRLGRHELFIETLAWHPSTHHLLSSSADGSVRIWDVDVEKEIRQLLGHGGPVFAASWNSDGTAVISTGLPEDQLHAWDVSDIGGNAFDRELQDHPSIAWHPDGIQMAIAEGSNILIVGQTGDLKTLSDAEFCEEDIFGVAFDNTGKRIACVSPTGKIWTVDAESGKQLKVYDEGSDQVLFPEPTGKSIAWSPDGKYLAGVGSKRTVKVWEELSGENVAAEVGRRMGNSLVIAWHGSQDDDPPLLAFAGKGDDLSIFDPLTREIVKSFEQHGWKTGLDWSPDGTRIAVSDRRSIGVWDVESAVRIGSCDGPSAMIRDISWSDQQGRLAAVAENGMVCLWNADSLAYCAKFNLHQRSPYCVSWSPDGKQLASTARFGRIVLQTNAVK